ncbi:uncharacterized protein LOC115533528 [Gadus morhua]|uniref:uncharacterized protein LOC115533528 n=1 Tax=Gadus morhua TaxID=8049 RepID=UPI0011B35C50|nr:uncharacterized protein LOC115533528 [Gadus morhua]
MELQTFTSRDRTELNPDIVRGLTDFERKLAEHFERVEIRGKREYPSARKISLEKGRLPYLQGKGLDDIEVNPEDEVEMSDDSSEENVADLHQCKGSITETARDQTLLRHTPESTSLDNMEGTSESTSLDNMEGTSESTSLDNMEGTSESTTLYNMEGTSESTSLDNMKGTPESTTLDNMEGTPESTTLDDVNMSHKIVTFQASSKGSKRKQG